MKPDLERALEALAAYAHEAWAGWMRYQKEKAPEAWSALPEWARQRWERQMTISYTQLPESEKESDRDEARKMMALLREHAAPGYAGFDGLSAEKRRAIEAFESTGTSEQEKATSAAPGPVDGLLPCPFCAVEAKPAPGFEHTAVFVDHLFDCPLHDDLGHRRFWPMTGWNRRAAPAPADAISWLCDNCGTSGSDRWAHQHGKTPGCHLFIPLYDESEVAGKEP